MSRVDGRDYRLDISQGIYSDFVYNKPPPVIAHAPIRDYFQNTDVLNFYQKVSKMCEIDTKLNTSLIRVSEAIRMAYKGLVLEVGEKEDSGEKQLIEEMQDFEDDFEDT